MRAVRFHGRGDIRIGQIEESICQAGQVKIRPAFVGICGSALVEPITVAWHAVNRSPIEAARTVLVVGGGPIGLAVVQVLKARGVERIVGIRARGTITIVSLWEEKPVLDALDVVLSEKHVIGSVICDDGDFEVVIDAIWSGKLNPEPMITSKICMEEIEEKGFKTLASDRDKHVKILVDISAGYLRHCHHHGAVTHPGQHLQVMPYTSILAALCWDPYPPVQVNC
ncbi:hypothetical protein BBP40_003874 [Aspergillus hancockii]|nr:hypothetical protein BBP40_003874 [Aspergillus hancockii]